MNLSDNDFALFGVPEKFALDRTELDARWRQLQDTAHPDRFAAEGGASQRLAMQWSVRINEAYKRLRDPLSRAAYLCELRGAAVNAERNTAMPASFLVQQLHWREALEEAVDEQAVQALDADVARASQVLLAEIEELLDRDNQPQQAAERVRSLMFLSKFRRDIANRLDSLAEL
jgi:molecular chaperone HscB